MDVIETQEYKHQERRNFSLIYTWHKMKISNDTEWRLFPVFHELFVQVEIKGCRAILHNLHKVLAETLCPINLGLQIQNYHSKGVSECRQREEGVERMADWYLQGSDAVISWIYNYTELVFRKIRKKIERRDSKQPQSRISEWTWSIFLRLTVCCVIS